VKSPGHLSWSHTPYTIGVLVVEPRMMSLPQVSTPISSLRRLTKRGDCGRESYHIRTHLFIQHKNPEIYATGSHFVLVYWMPKLAQKIPKSMQCIPSHRSEMNQP
jgi:hypothetical protein